LLEAGVLIDGLTTYRGRVFGIAGAACEGYLEAGLANIVEAQLDRDAEMAAVAGDEIAEAETETRRDFVEVDASGAVERVCVAADVILAAECDRAARGDDSGGEDTVVIAEDDLRAEAEASTERKPIEGCMAGAEVQLDANVCALFLEGGGVAEQVSTGAQVELSCEWCGNVEACASEAYPRGESYSGEWAVGLCRGAGSWRTTDEAGCAWGVTGAHRNGVGIERGVLESGGLREGVWNRECDRDGAECKNVRLHWHLPFVEWGWTLYRRRMMTVQWEESLFSPMVMIRVPDRDWRHRLHNLHCPSARRR
jgi:hypothetical protein